jgi:uncharacterized protein (DUF2147 family)
MKRLAWFVLLALLAFSFLAAFPLSAGQRIEGLWLVEKEEAHIKIERCGDQLCARIVWMKESNDEKGNPRRDIRNPDEEHRDRPMLGMNLLKDVPAEPNGNGVWSGGRIYDPQRGRYYRCTIRLDEPNRLRLRGYLGISLLGRTTRWTRISPGESPAPRGVPSSRKGEAQECRG